MSTDVLKVKDVLALAGKGNPIELVVCSLDKNRPKKSGKKLHYKNAILKTHSGQVSATLLLANGEVTTIHPVLITQFNGTTVVP